MVLVDHTAPVAARTRSAAQLDETEMKRSASFAGTVNIGLALGDQHKQEKQLGMHDRKDEIMIHNPTK